MMLSTVRASVIKFDFLLLLILGMGSSMPTRSFGLGGGSGLGGYHGNEDDVRAPGKVVRGDALWNKTRLFKTLPHDFGNEKANERMSSRRARAKQAVRSRQMSEQCE